MADITETTTREPTPFMAMVASICAPPPKSAYVYPRYIVHLLRGALECDPDGLIEPQSFNVETLGSARYAVSCRDMNGANYKITVEVTRG